RTPSQPGNNVALTLDMTLQQVAENAFGERRGALVAIEPESGGVLAFVSKPGFDPNLFVDGIDPQSWAELNNSIDKPLNNDAIAGFMKHFGFGERTGIDLQGEATGVLPSPEWKMKRFKRPEQQKWYAGETISIGIGQGYNAYTPIQLAQAMATLANGGAMYRPHLIAYVDDPRSGERRPVEPELVHKVPVRRDHPEFVK